MFCLEGPAGNLAAGARAPAAGKEEMLYMFTTQSNRRASERDFGHAVPASWVECPRVLLRNCPRLKNLTPKAPYV